MMDLDYYPKLQCCVPFSPVPGPRLLAVESEGGVHSRRDVQRALASSLVKLMGG